jgi:hypothetical protein
MSDFSSLVEKKYRWPKRGDRIAQHVSKPTDAYVSDVVYERAVFIWRGYFKAGMLLAEKCESDPFEVNYLVYPMMFNFRHGLEVAMKELIADYGPLVDVHLGEKDHNLLDLWSLFSRISNELNPNAGDDADRAVALVVKDFHELDKDAVAFRYSVNKNGAAFKFASGIVTISRLKEVMESCTHYFEGSDDYYQDLKRNLPNAY